MSSSGDLLDIPKPYSLNNHETKHYNFHDKMIKIAAIGLPLGGLLSIILSLLVLWSNTRLLRQENLTAENRIYAKNLVIISIILCVIGIAFFSLFIMHLIF